MSIKASMYDTTKPYYKCRPAEGRCTFPLSFMGANAAVLTSPGRVPVSTLSDEMIFFEQINLTT